MICKRTAYLIAIGLTCATTPSYAGFQWVPGQGSANTMGAGNYSSSPYSQVEDPMMPDSGDGLTYMPDPVQSEPVSPPPSSQSADDILVPMMPPAENSSQAATDEGFFAPIQNLFTPEESPRDVPDAQNQGTRFQWIGQEEETPSQKSWGSGMVMQQKPLSAAPVMPGAVVMPQSAGNSPYETVQGFGSDMPLVLALRQVIPAEYSYSFGRDINMGANVSWNGGKPWDLVLNEMLAPLDMHAEITGRNVRFEKGPKRAAPQAMQNNSQPMQENSYAEISPPRRNITDPGVGGLVPMASETYKAPVASEPAHYVPPHQNIEVRMHDEAAPVPITPSAGDSGYDSYHPNRPMQEQEDDVSWLESVSQSVSQKMAKIGEDFRSGNKVDAADVRMWEAQKGDSLKTTLVQWSKEANVTLVWNSSRDYTLDSNVLVNGTFTNAVKTVFTEGITKSNKPNLKLVDNPNSSQSTTFIVSDNG